MVLGLLDQLQIFLQLYLTEFLGGLLELWHLIYPRLLTGFGMLVFFANLSLMKFQVRYLALLLLFLFLLFFAAKTYLVLFDQSNNTGSVDVKRDGSVLEEKSSFKMLGLTLSSKLDWGSYIISLLKLP